MSRNGKIGHCIAVLHNWILGFLAISIWVGNYVFYFARDFGYGRRDDGPEGWPTHAPRDVTGPLPAQERLSFPQPEPPPPPPPVHDAEIIPFPKRVSGRRR